jgi:parallel beta-helix repeat protein
MNNNISYNDQIGLTVQSSSNINIVGNNFTHDGIGIFSAQHNIPTNNIVNGKPIYYYKDTNNIDIDGISVGQLIIANCVNVNVSNIQINNTDFGIIVAYSSNINITHCNISSNYLAGINYFQSTDGNITYNNLTNNTQGIYLKTSSDNNNIMNNNISSNDMGIEIALSSNINITHNNLYQNTETAIRLSISSGNNIISNNVFKNKDGIFISPSSNNSVKNNQISLNTKYGVFVSSSSDNLITGNNISSTNEYGIFLIWSSNNVIEYNNISGNGEGIYFQQSLNNNITNNNLSNNGKGIYLSSSSDNNSISNNSIFSNNVSGIHLHRSSYNNIINNGFISDGVFISGSILAHFNTHTISVNNQVNGKPLRYYKNLDGIDIDGNIDDIGELIFANCSDISVKNLEINNTDVGIEAVYGSNINLTGNNFTNNIYGYYVEESSNVNITDNNITNNEYGISFTKIYNDYNLIRGNYIDSNTIDGISFSASTGSIIDNEILNNDYGVRLSSSSVVLITNNNISFNIVSGLYLTNTFGSQIYYNNFINNTQQVRIFGTHIWDNGYPLGGNYWSDYDGVDQFKGPNQNILGIDEIGDTPYVLNSNNQDNYPLMLPYKPLENYMILKQGWNMVSLPFIQEEQNLTRVLGSIDSWYDAVQWYDPIDPWKHHKVGKPYGNDLFELNETMGFWIHITNPGDTIFIYNGTKPTSNQTITLYQGWNMVGYPSLTIYNRTEGLNNLTFNTHVDAILSYDTATQKYKQLTDTDYFEIGKGYYIHAKEEYTWVVPL